MSSPAPLSRWTKLVYGSGGYGLSAFGMLRQIFYAIFLTDVVGLDPRLASIGALVGIIWDAFNDPLVGVLSDRLRSRWGRRRPFLLWFSIPFGLSFVILWWAPPWESQLALVAYVTFAYMLSDTLGTLVAVPYTAMTPEISSDYDERTSLTSYRMFFQLAASLTTAVAAPAIVNAGLAAGWTQQQGYLLVSALFGGIAVPPLLLIFLFVRERSGRADEDQAHLPFGETLRAAWANVPFRFAALMNVLNWMAVDLVALMIPFFLLYWVAQGDMLARVGVFGLPVTLGSAVFGLLLSTSILALPLWTWLARRFNKSGAYVAGLLVWTLAQGLIYTVQPGEVARLLGLAFLAGLGLSNAHVLPDAIFPDVIEWDELRTRRRQEGIYYGVKNFIRKLTGALTIFLALQTLGWAGYQTPPEGATAFQQPERVLAVIRLLVGPAGAVLLFGAAATAWYYPLTRERHGRVRRLLDRRKSKTR
jgi:glycoside/pentoside/hexuronide:cation symporter, GPH family